MATIELLTEQEEHTMRECLRFWNETRIGAWTYADQILTMDEEFQVSWGVWQVFCEQMLRGERCQWCGDNSGIEIDDGFGELVCETCGRVR